MSESGRSGGERRGPSMSDPTAVDLTSPLDGTERHLDPEVPGAPGVPDMQRQTQLTSDPPTALVPRDNFRDLLPGTVVDDLYEIDARLGAGAMGEVYAARHMRLGKRVAIKVINRRLSEDSAAIERFAREARTLAKIQHPAIVAIEHVGELADGRAYFSMEFLLGETLFDRSCRGRVPLVEALRILDQMARGLEAAHAQGVIHRDLKPENVFLAHLPSEEPIVKLVDFGLAKLAADVRDVDFRAERTQSGVAIGTPMYMSPEQMRGPDVDQRTDVYALGCVAYELVLGQPPFPHARTAPELYAAHLHESPPLPRSIWPEIPPQLDLCLFAMLAKDPAYRPTLAQFRSVIADVRTRSPSQRAATEFVIPRAAKPRRTVAIVAVVFVALIGGITIGATVGKRPSSVPVTVPPTAAPDDRKLQPIAPQLPQPPLQPPPPAVPRAESPATAESKPTQQPSPRNRNNAPRSSAGQPPKAGSAVSAPADPDDAGVDDHVEERSTSPPPVPDKTVPKTKPVDRDQTINPFKRKVIP